MKLNNLFEDGADTSSQIVALILKEKVDCDFDISIARWYNCREQGYITSARTKDFKRQMNIAFFEHRNSDQICAVKWEQTSINPLTIDTAELGDIYKEKYDVFKAVSWNQPWELATWIFEQFQDFLTEEEK